MFLHVDRDKARSGPHHVRATGFFGRLSLILFALAASGISIAQTCEAPALWLNPILPLAGTTCGDEQIADPLCGGVPNPGPNHVVRIFLGGQQAATLGISGGESGFDPVLYLSDAALGCARLRSAALGCDAATCIASGIPGQRIDLTGLPAGEYQLVVAAAANDAANACGAFSLDLLGDLNQDIIFRSGFE